ncbi:DMT family transporter [Roseovarius nanhaiticus]|uniref:DMT family transporter n=1 Tax=Roseovarius nanhaiticus TaxID=573024 RepID=UPI0024923181|nr:DMT family transporter [Roseovarius nanhaiticus]
MQAAPPPATSLTALPAARVTLGILLMVAFSLTAPIMDSFAKMIGSALPVAQVAAIRFFAQALLLTPLAWAMGWLHMPGRSESGLHLVRAALLLIATGCFFFSLQFMPVADAIAIFFVEPFILTLLGGLLLGEAIGPRRYIACAIGFAGAMLVIRPSFQNVGAPALLPLVTALLFAFYMILTRRMATRMHPITLQAYTGIAALVLAVPVLVAANGSGLAQFDPEWPAAREAWLLVGLGLAATVSHICISFALKFAPASTLAPVQYLEIVTATAFGFWIFGDLPDTMAFCGIALIVASGLFVFLRERHLERRPLPQP